VVVNATASDGVIEGIEAPRYRFCIGVQWHPEFLIYIPRQLRLFGALVRAAKTYGGP
jgi:putative glutamine amidotransferase